MQMQVAKCILVLVRATLRSNQHMIKLWLLHSGLRWKCTIRREAFARWTSRGHEGISENA